MLSLIPTNVKYANIGELPVREHFYQFTVSPEQVFVGQDRIVPVGEQSPGTLVLFETPLMYGNISDYSVFRITVCQ